MRIAVVEDSGATRYVLEALLRSRGHEVTGSYSDAESAFAGIMERLEETDLLLADIFLEGKETGIELALKLRPHKKLPVVYLTSSDDPSVVEKAQKSKPYGYILKPVKELIFFSTLEIVERRMEAENRFRRRIDFEQLVADIYRRLHQAGEPDFHAILKSLSLFARCDRSFLFRLDEKKEAAIAVAAYPEAAYPEEGRGPSVSESVPFHLLPTLHEIFPDQREEFLHFTPSESQLLFDATPVNYRAMPIFFPEGSTEGIIVFDRFSEGSSWSPWDERLLRMVAGMIGGWWYRKKTEESLQRAQRSVIHQDKLAVIGMLSGGIIHEIANPLSFVEANNRMLHKMVSTLLQSSSEGQCRLSCEEAREVLDMVGENSEGLGRIKGIIASMRGFSAGAGQSGSNGGRKEWYNLNDGIRSILALIGTFIKEQAEVELELGDIPELLCHGARINHVLLSLLMNAAQAVAYPESQEQKGTIRIESGLHEGMLFCRVCDNGERCETAEKREEREMRIAAVKEIVESDHGGTISFTADSAATGNCFTITFPLNSDADVDLNLQ